MKRYIRTHDGIYERLKPSEDCPEVEDDHWLSVVNGIINKDNEPIIAEADTLEELCDIYIEQDKKLILHKWNGNKMVIDWTTNQVYSLKELSAWDIKGAIYTDEGLIYVTKLDAEGESELLWKD